MELMNVESSFKVVVKADGICVCGRALLSETYEPAVVVIVAVYTPAANSPAVPPIGTVKAGMVAVIVVNTPFVSWVAVNPEPATIVTTVFPEESLTIIPLTVAAGTPVC